MCIGGLWLIPPTRGFLEIILHLKYKNEKHVLEYLRGFTNSAGNN